MLSILLCINFKIAALYLGAPEHEARVLQELVRHQRQHPRPVSVARTQHLPDLGDSWLDAGHLIEMYKLNLGSPENILQFLRQ